MNESFGLLILWFSSPFSRALDSLTSLQDYEKEKKNNFEEIIRISVQKKRTPTTGSEQRRDHIFDEKG